MENGTFIGFYLVGGAKRACFLEESGAITYKSDMEPRMQTSLVAKSVADAKKQLEELEMEQKRKGTKTGNV